MPIERIIVLADDLSIRKNLEQQLRQRRHDVASAGTIAEAQELLGRDDFDLIFVDVRLPDGEATDLLRQLQVLPQKPLVVVVTEFGSIESAVSCMRDGAFDYIIKPFSPDQIEFTVKKAGDFSRLVKVSQYLSHEETADTGDELLGRSAVIEELRQLIRKVAHTQAPVLIQGESGAGKELVARAICRESPRANAPFIKVNCAAIPENLIESELFGHEKGALTGALNRRAGRFELAHGGTILLDEVSAVPPPAQAKLLRVLQDRELERVGGNRTIKVDVRVVATTNRRLEQCVERKEFRQDLYLCLNVVPVLVPPLRERREDVAFLAEQFMHRMARKHGVRVRGIAAPCLAQLLAHHWPGNVRELQNVIERAVILCGDGEDLQPDHLGFAAVAMPARLPVAASKATPSSAAAPTAPATATDELLPLSELEKRQILLTLERCNGNRTHAAKRLGISIRTLRNKLHEYSATGKEDSGADEEKGG